MRTPTTSRINVRFPQLPTISSMMLLEGQAVPAKELPIRRKPVRRMIL
jgi:hypothetical protein